jgi:hypothetical protein
MHYVQMLRTQEEYFSRCLSSLKTTQLAQSSLSAIIIQEQLANASWL